MIRVVCECGKQLQARDESAGKRMRCPGCQRILTVPNETVPEDAVQLKPSDAANSEEEGVQLDRPRRRDDAEWEEDVGEDRPRRQPAGNSKRAVVSLVLGILSLFCNVLAGIPALILGFLALREIGRSRGRLSGHGLAIAGIVTACVCTFFSCIALLPALLLPAVQKVREAANKAQSMNNLKQIALALQNYNDTYGTLPPAAIGDPDKPAGKRRALLSWRVAILPYIEQQGLYNQFKLDESWDGPNNRRLLGQMPMIYKLAADDKTPSDHTHYQVFVGKGAAFDRTTGHNIPREFRDGTDTTILVAEVENSVQWSKPDDVEFDPNKPIVPLMSTYFSSVFQVAMADGTIRQVSPKISESTLKAAITRNGRDALGPDW